MEPYEQTVSAQSVLACFEKGVDVQRSFAYDGPMILTSHVRPIPLLADVGIPMILISLPGMIALLLPVIVIEALFVMKRTSLPAGKVFKATAAANVSSTLLGVPLAWSAFFVCEMIVALGLIGLSQVAPKLNDAHLWNSPAANAVGSILFAAWIGGEGPTWTVPLAALTLLIPSFFVSVWIERKIMRRKLLATTAGVSLGDGVSEERLRSAVRDANLLSYAFLAVVCSAWLIWGIFHP